MEFDFLKINHILQSRVDLLWTFMLLIMRFSGVIMVLPGIGNGVSGMRVRATAILMFSMAATFSSPVAILPDSIAGLLIQGASEALLGLVIGLLPALIVSGVQTAGTLSSTTMGLGAAQLVDPTFGGSVTSLARIFGDIAILLFLLMGGHHAIIYAASGVSHGLVPGTFLIDSHSVDLLINRTGDIFRLGVLVSAPVIVALLLTQFVMGLITKAVPQVNIFIVSFPLTIGIGLVLSALSLPEIIVFLQKELQTIDASLAVLLSGV